MKKDLYERLIAAIVIAFACTSIAKADDAGMLYERWMGDGTAESMLTETEPADYTEVVSTGQWGVGDDNAIEHYRSRLTGYLRIPATGTYYFWINTDDNGVLWLSGDSSPAKATRICQETDWSDENSWASIGSDEEVSQGIQLREGQICWIRGGQQEGGGGDHIQIAWQCAEAGITAPTVLAAPYVFWWHPNAATDPDPVDQAVDVSLDKVMSWSMPVDPNITGTHVYFGADPANLTYRGVQAAGDTDYDPAADGAALVADLVYYWRIDTSINGSGKDDPNTVTGHVWSFKSLRTIPDILSPPVDLTSIPGMDAIFSMDVYNPLTGDASGLEYAWKRAGDDTVVSMEPKLVISNVTLADEGDYYCTVTNSNGSRDSAPAALDILNEVVHWKFSEIAGSTAADSTGNGIDGTVGAGAVWVPGGGHEGDGAIHLPGISSATVIATGVDLTTKPVGNIFLGSSPWTINLWINFQSPAGISMIGGFGDCDYVGGYDDRYYDTWDGTVEFNFGDDGFWYTGYTAKKWQMWTLTFDNTTRTLTYYRDGVAIESKQGVTLDDVTENAFKLGDVGAVAWADTTVPINAIFDDFCVYDGAVSAKDIVFLYTKEFTCNQAPAMDFDGDCRVGASDLARLLEGWLEDNMVK